MCFNYYLSSSNHLLYWTEQSFSMFGLVNEPHSWPQAWQLQINEQRMLDHTDSVPGQFLCYDIKIDFRFSHRFLSLIWIKCGICIFSDKLYTQTYLWTRCTSQSTLILVVSPIKMMPTHSLSAERILMKTTFNTLRICSAVSISTSRVPLCHFHGAKLHHKHCKYPIEPFQASYRDMQEVQKKIWNKYSTV